MQKESNVLATARQQKETTLAVFRKTSFVSSALTDSLLPLSFFLSAARIAFLVSSKPKFVSTCWTERPTSLKNHRKHSSVPPFFSFLSWLKVCMSLWKLGGFVGDPNALETEWLHEFEWVEKTTSKINKAILNPPHNCMLKNHQTPYRRCLLLLLQTQSVFHFTHMKPKVPCLLLLLLLQAPLPPASSYSSSSSSSSCCCCCCCC